MNPDQKHLQEYEALYKAISAESATAHFEDAKNLVSSAKDIKKFRLEAINRRIAVMTKNLQQI